MSILSALLRRWPIKDIVRVLIRSPGQTNLDLFLALGLSESAESERASVDDRIYEGWSAPFGVEPGSTAEVDTQVYPPGINTEPWKPLGLAWNETFMTELPATSFPGIVSVTDYASPSPTMPAMVNIAGNENDNDIL